MLTAKSQLAQDTVAAMAFVLVLGSLSMVWPSIMALIFGFFLLLQSIGIGQEIAVLSSADMTQLPIIFAPFRRSGLLSILS